MSGSDKKKPDWPRYLPYTPVAMGMIQPEWVFMSHFFDEEEDEPESAADLQSPAAEGAALSGPENSRQEPLIRIRARKSR